MLRATSCCALILATFFISSCSRSQLSPQPVKPAPPAKAAQPSSAVGAEITARLTFECFDEGLMRTPEKPATCEPSAILWQNGTVLLGNDKPIPGAGRSPVFSLSYSNNTISPQPTQSLTAPAFSMARKYEDFSITPDGQYILAATGFDRVDPGSAAFDPYSTLLYWPKGQPEAVQVANPSTRDGIESSQFIRERLSLAMKNETFPDGMPYFKVEAMVAIPGDVLLFGIREWGKHYDDFNYSTRIIAASYSISNERLTVADDFKEVYSFDTSAVPESIAISSLAYDPHNEQLFILTSYETGHNDEGIGGYLWRLPIGDFNQGLPPQLVRKSDGSPLRFAHKAEGVTVVDKSTVMVIHDDDRVLGRKEITDPEIQFGRTLNQAFLDVVSVP